jgi:hypothetical protein
MYTTVAAVMHSFPDCLLTVHLHTTAAAAAAAAAAALLYAPVRCDGYTGKV